MARVRRALRQIIQPETPRKATWSFNPHARRLLVASTPQWKAPGRACPGRNQGRARPNQRHRLFAGGGGMRGRQSISNRAPRLSPTAIKGLDAIAQIRSAARSCSGNSHYKVPTANTGFQCQARVVTALPAGSRCHIEQRHQTIA